MIIMQCDDHMANLQYNMANPQPENNVKLTGTLVEKNNSQGRNLNKLSFFFKMSM